MAKKWRQKNGEKNGGKKNLIFFGSGAGLPISILILHDITPVHIDLQSAARG
jgi:hypothetical protein